ncbi:neuropeptide Y receptor type 1-like [Gigantopelta aegis]|uniref:neuropeptide Y receptor type 1-like n=1 Tax=Gigantopelta aegis TaxID=1735272 RepID=UPI001B887985|nr:neuropeptide Y receptor type 1-like [Gigantopelta aegis]
MSGDDENETGVGQHRNINLEIEYDHEDSDNIPFTIVYCIFILLIIIGNSMILTVIIWRRELKTPRIVYIVSLITSDMMVASIVIPLAILTQYKLFLGSSVVCKITMFLKYVTVTANLYCIVAIATDRHQVIMSIFKSRPQKSRSALFVFFVWMFAALYSLRPGFTYGLTHHEDKVIRQHMHMNHSLDSVEHEHMRNETDFLTHTTCGLEFERFRHLFIILDFLIICLLPLFIISVLYIRVIAWLVRQRKRNCAVSRTKNQNVKLIQMVLVIVVTYTVCQLPSHVFQMYVYFGPGVDNDAEFIYDVLTIFTYLNSVLNVCIYSLFDTRIYRFVKMAFCCDRTVSVQDIASISQTPTSPRSGRSAANGRTPPNSYL